MLEFLHIAMHDTRNTMRSSKLFAYLLLLMDALQQEGVYFAFEDVEKPNLDSDSNNEHQEDDTEFYLHRRRNAEVAVESPEGSGKAEIEDVEFLEIIR